MAPFSENYTPKIVSRTFCFPAGKAGKLFQAETACTCNSALAFKMDTTHLGTFVKTVRLGTQCNFYCDKTVRLGTQYKIYCVKSVRLGTPCKLNHYKSGRLGTISMQAIILEGIIIYFSIVLNY